MRALSPAFFIFCFLSAVVLPQSSAAQSRPNVVLIIMDDLGYGDLGSYGVPDAKTPHLDRLAREGVRLTDFYANAPNCSPTRTGLISGRYQQRYGIEQPIPIGNTDIGLLPSESSLPRLLKTAGYTTGLVGKWHVGAGAQFRPGRHGFDEFWGFLGSSADYYRHGWAAADAAGRIDPEKLTSALFHNDEPVTFDGYLTDGITVNAKRFLEAQQPVAPFFLEVTYNAPHFPFQGPHLPPGQRDRRAPLLEGTRAEYVAMVEHADKGVGEILALLDAKKLASNTIVIFTSDNGGEWLSRNAPFFNRKSSVWEGGIRVPLLVRWPGHMRPGSVSRQVGMTMDLTASIVAAAGVTPPGSYRPDGIDLFPSLAQGTTIDRTLFWRVNANGFVQKAVRRGAFKFLQEGSGTVEGYHEFLFDLTADPGERHDLSQTQPARLRELRQLVAGWEADVTAEFKQRQVVITPGVHSSIQIEHAGTVIQVDPWSVGDLSKAKPADLILITDDVGHHLDVKAIGQLRKAGAPVVIAANGQKQVPDAIVMNNGDTKQFGAIRVEAIGAYDIKPGEPYHPKGEANGYVITVGGQRIYVVGVTECVPEVRAVKNVDVAFFPLNLPLARMEPAAAIECLTAMAPKVVYPYHYDQEWVRPVPAGGARPTPTKRGLQELKAALTPKNIDVRLADWYPK